MDAAVSARDFQKLGTDTLRLALLASAELGRELGAGGEGDTKRAKELSGILKDMAQLARELRYQDARPVTVRFVDETEEASG